jgi:hypothetical protein
MAIEFFIWGQAPSSINKAKWGYDNKPLSAQKNYNISESHLTSLIIWGFGDRIPQNYFTKQYK